MIVLVHTHGRSVALTVDEITSGADVVTDATVVVVAGVVVVGSAVVVLVVVAVVVVVGGSVVVDVTVDVVSDVLVLVAQHRQTQHSLAYSTRIVSPA